VRHLRIEFSPDALGQLRAIRDWWPINRPSAPELLHEELVATLETIRSSPHVAKVYQFSAIPGLRRALMPRTRYHLYFTFHEERALIFVHAIWHASRGQGPPL
jgi:plasmid stabilization system protein ParE